MKRTIKILFIAFLAYTIWNSDSFRFLKGFFVDTYKNFELSSAAGSEVGTGGTATDHSQEAELQKLIEKINNSQNSNQSGFLSAGEELLLINQLIEMQKKVVLNELKAQKEADKEELRQYALFLISEIKKNKITITTPDGNTVSAQVNFATNLNF